ncbi:MAG: MBL fold metallo-hydrolase [Gemmatimonadota bacterium]
MSLRLTFWGTRGSIPSPGPHTARYGGNTPCVEVRTGDGHLLILDAGTGIRALGRSLVEQAEGASIEADLFLTHAHWDHIQGIPFFAPLFGRGNRLRIWGSAALERSVDQVVRDQMSPVVFPVSFEALAATIEFRSIVEGTPMLRSGYEVAAFGLHHPGGALGYRFTDHAGDAGSLVYIPDNELAPHPGYGSSPMWRDRLTSFVRGASVLIHDAMYTPEEYTPCAGWGHSTHREAVTLALAADVRTLVLFHHDPQRTDDALDRCVAECRELVRRAGASLEVIAAAEGLSLHT